MQKLLEKIVVPVLLGILAFAGSIIAAIFSPNSLLIHPVFDITYDGGTEATSSSEANNTTYRIVNNVKITNTGWIQARNVQIDIGSLFDSKLVSSSCPEAEISPDGNLTKHHKTKLDRLSVNLDCVVSVISGEIPLEQAKDMQFTVVSSIVVTADNTPAYKLDLPSKQTESLSNPTISILTSSIVIGFIFGIAMSILRHYLEYKQN